MQLQWFVLAELVGVLITNAALIRMLQQLQASVADQNRSLRLLSLILARDQGANLSEIESDFLGVK